MLVEASPLKLFISDTKSETDKKKKKRRRQCCYDPNGKYNVYYQKRIIKGTAAPHPLKFRYTSVYYIR